MRLRGRDFGWQDDMQGESTVILNEKAANYVAPGEDAVGKTVLINRERGKGDSRVAEFMRRTSRALRANRSICRRCR